METTQARITTADILRDLLAKKMDRNRLFSLRAFARDLGVSHTYLSLVMNGKKPLSMTRVIQFSHMLEMQDHERAAFIAAGSREARTRAFQKVKPGAPSPGKSKPTQETYFEMESDRFCILNEWYHLPILDLTLTKDFKSDPKWIAGRLGISSEQVRNAIERLKRLKLLVESNGRLFKTKEHIMFEPKKPSQVVRSFHRQMIGKALAALESGHSEDVEARSITAVTVPINPAKIAEAKRKMEKFRLKLWKFLSEGECTELYQFNLQLFPLTVRKRKLGSKGIVLKRGAK